MKGEIRKSFYTTVSHPFEFERVEAVACNACGGERYRVLGTEHGFAIRECADCGLVYVSPQPVREELARFYDNMYLEDPETLQAQAPGYVESHLRRIVRRRKPEGGRLLEIGCGYGGFLARMADLPWELHGIEMSRRAAEEARRRVPRADIACTGIEEATFPVGHFDCIVSVAVLEHMKDPRATLRRQAEWLAPGGLLLVQVPHVAPFYRLKQWLPFMPIHFEAPRHLFDFSPRTLPRYLEEAGCRDVRVEIARPYASPSRTGLALIWAVKLPGLALYHATGGRYIYPFAAAIVAHGMKGQ